MLRHPEIVRGLHVGVLGCGLGVEGLAAAVAGAARVTLLDRESTALACAVRSAAELGYVSEELANMEPIDVPVARECEREFDRCFGIRQTRNAEAFMSVVRSHRDVIRAELFDWNHVSEDAKPRFDVLLASDVIYESGAVSPVVGLVPRLLKPPRRNANNELCGGVLLAGDPPHRTPANRAKFIAAMKEVHGMVMASRAHRVKCTVCADDALSSAPVTCDEDGMTDEVVLMAGRLPRRKSRKQHHHHGHHREDHHNKSSAHRSIWMRHVD